MEYPWRESLIKMILKKSLKNKGGILIITIFVITIISWLISLTGIYYKNQKNLLKNIREKNSKDIQIKNYFIFGERELKNGDKLINLGEYKDIIEYFEGKDKIWINEKGYSKSKYRRFKLYQNAVEIKGPLILLKEVSNSLDIILIKEIIIDSMTIRYSVFLYYEYLKGELNINNPTKRKIKSFNVERVLWKV